MSALNEIDLILYTRLFMKLKLFQILFYGTFITAKISRSMVVQDTNRLQEVLNRLSE